MLDTAVVEQLVYPLSSTSVDLISITAHALNNQLYALTKQCGSVVNFTTEQH